MGKAWVALGTPVPVSMNGFLGVQTVSLTNGCSSHQPAPLTGSVSAPLLSSAPSAYRSSRALCMRQRHIGVAHKTCITWWHGVAPMLSVSAASCAANRSL